VKKWAGKCKGALSEIRDFLDEKGIGSVNRCKPSRLHGFAHFWLLVWKNFSRNRCPVKASALAYTTLLALIPMLFVAVSVSSSILKSEGEQRINQFIDQMLASLTPPSAPGTNASPATTDAANGREVAGDGAASTTNNLSSVAAADDAKPISGRDELVRNINHYVQNIQGAKLGVTGGAMLVFIAISLLSRIESTFNDIWGVSRGRSIMDQIVKYSAVIFLGPLLLVLGLALTGAPRMQSTRRMIESMPFLFHLLPVVLLCLSFAVFYILMPNTKVHWKAALVGGTVGGVLWHLNNYFSILYVSRWVSNSKIFGSLAVIPVFMVGLYFAWLILLFGAQVAYGYQNRAAYLQEKQAENINQRGREFIALRLMQWVGQRFLHGETPATVQDMADGLVVPTRLVQQIMHTLIAARLVVEVAGGETAYAPARPLERINCHDILQALRAGQGQELATRDGPARTEVYGEFQKILDAEQKAASGVSVLAMVNRTEELAALSAHSVKAVTDGQEDGIDSI
jgi:membrane protein